MICKEILIIKCRPNIELRWWLVSVQCKHTQSTARMSWSARNDHLLDGRWDDGYVSHAIWMSFDCRLSPFHLCPIFSSSSFIRSSVPEFALRWVYLISDVADMHIVHGHGERQTEKFNVKYDVKYGMNKPTEPADRNISANRWRAHITPPTWE